MSNYGYIPRRHARKIEPWIMRLQNATDSLQEDMGIQDTSEVLESLTDVSFWQGRVMCDLLSAGMAPASDPQLSEKVFKALAASHAALAEAQEYLLQRISPPSQDQEITMRHYVDYGNYGSDWGYGNYGEFTFGARLKSSLAQISGAKIGSGGKTINALWQQVAITTSKESGTPLEDIKFLPGGTPLKPWAEARGLEDAIHSNGEKARNPKLAPLFGVMKKMASDANAPQTAAAVVDAAKWFYQNVEVPAQAAAPAPPPPTAYEPYPEEALVSKPRRKRKRKGKKKKKKSAESWWAENWWVPVAGAGGLVLIALLMKQTKRRPGASSRRPARVTG